MNTVTRNDGRVIRTTKVLKFKQPFTHKSCGRVHTEIPAGVKAMIECDIELFNGIQMPCACGSHSTIFWSQVVIDSTPLEAAEEVDALLENPELSKAATRFLDGEISKDELHAEIARITGWTKVGKAA